VRDDGFGLLWWCDQCHVWWGFTVSATVRATPDRDAREQDDLSSLPVITGWFRKLWMRLRPLPPDSPMHPRLARSLT
jgi:hypothetical protein